MSYRTPSLLSVPIPAALVHMCPLLLPLYTPAHCSCPCTHVPTAAVLVHGLLSRSSRHGPGVWYPATAPANAFVPTPARRDRHTQLIFIMMPQSYEKSATLCHNLVRGDCDFPEVSQIITLVTRPDIHHINDITLIRAAERTVETTFAYGCHACQII